MQKKNQLGFIKEKISKLGNAILHCHSENILKLPTTLAKTLQADDEGNIWVAIKKPVQFLNEYERCFFTALNYYKKGEPFYLNILGVAKIIIDPEEINNLPANIKHHIDKDQLILNIHIQEANYYEVPEKKAKNTFVKWKEYLTSFFITNNEYYHISLSDKENFA